MRSPLILGSRGSQLALWQAHFVQNWLERHADIRVHLEIIRTTGDQIQEAPLPQPGGTKALFTKEIEEALLARRIDLAVHSLKDLAAELPAGLAIGAIPVRDDPRDVLISRSGRRLYELSSGSRVGTSSLRRQVQLKLLRQDLLLESLRGNVDTRIRKLDQGLYDAIVLAAAGLKRMGWTDRATQFFSPAEMIPAIGQGALAIEARADDGELLRLLERLNHPESAWATSAERAFLSRLGGGCQVPIAAHGEIHGEQLTLVGTVVSVDGRRALRGSRQGPVENAREIGRGLAEELLRQGADEILDAISQASLGAPGSA
jgi:hydroxymethylbilane synthase